MVEEVIKARVSIDLAGHTFTATAPDLIIDDTSIKPYNSDYWVYFTDPNANPPQYKHVVYRTLPADEIFGAGGDFWVNASDQMGYVVIPYFVDTVWSDPKYTLVLRMGTWEGKYAWYEPSKTNTRYFTPTPDGGMICNLQRMLQDYKYTSNGLLPFTNGRCNIMFGYVDKKGWYDSGIGGAAPLAFSGPMGGTYFYKR